MRPVVLGAVGAGHPEAQVRWIMKERGLQDYVDALGGLGGVSILRNMTATKTQPTTSDSTRILSMCAPGSFW
jgi:hypothetical protein